MRFYGKLYAITCKHVIRDFDIRKIFIPQQKQAAKGSKPAPVKTLCFPSSPVGEAVSSHIEDLCVIEFDDDIADDFFYNSEFANDEMSVAQSAAGDRLLVAGVPQEAA